MWVVYEFDVSYSKLCLKTCGRSVIVFVYICFWLLLKVLCLCILFSVLKFCSFNVFMACIVCWSTVFLCLLF